jgi:hypothetical protein
MIVRVGESEMVPRQVHDSELLDASLIQATDGRLDFDASYADDPC